MLTLSVSAILVFLSLEACQGFYMADYNMGTQRMPMCPSDSSPCRLKVLMRSLNGSLHEMSSTQTCTCSHPHHCSDDWDRRGYVISRRLTSTTYNMTLQMMFCNRVEPKLLCSSTDVALVVKGSLTLPRDIQTYNCRCRRRFPLILHQTRIGDDHMTYHTYVCANHMTVCRRGQTCQTGTDNMSTFHCKCQRGHQCRPSLTTSWGFVHRGYCSV